MARRAPAFARAFAGRWRIVEMDQWGDLDLLEPAHITFTGKNGGEFVFLAVQADLDVHYGSRDGAACAEFSWAGSDDDTPASGRGWVALGTAGRLSATSSYTTVMTPDLLPSASDLEQPF